MTGEGRYVREGLIVGLIAAVSVAVFYALFDLLAARGSLYTPSVLGQAVFRGLRSPSALYLPLTPDSGATLWYSALHLALALAIGLTVTGLVSHAERHPSRAGPVAFVIAAGFVVTILAVGWLTRDMRQVLPWWSIVAANALAVVVAGWYLVRRHPGLPGRLLPAGTRRIPQS